MSNQASLRIENNIIYCSGRWEAVRLAGLDTQLTKLHWPDTTTVVLDGTGIEKMDTAGAWLLNKCIGLLKAQNKQLQLTNFFEHHHALLIMVQEKADVVAKPTKPKHPPNWFYQIGKETHEKAQQIDGFLVLIGELAMRFARACTRVGRFQWQGIVSTIDKTGFCALPILALMSFLVGVVLAYQLGIQLQEYGANTFIVNLSGIAILREFAPLITAIVVAGRTGSAFTAQIGLMKVNEEIDALRTMGISPVERLVLPRILGLILVFPLLTFWADLFGILGSMVMSKGMLGIGYYDFMMRFKEDVELSNYLIGLSKAPVFALLIATVGCYQGLQVKSSAESVGNQTTRSVVQGLFLIIVADAGFSVLYTWAGI